MKGATREAFEAADDKDVASISVRCDRHGPTPWNGEIVCSRCGSFYDFDAAPSVCACKAPLMPEADYRRFTARLVCSPCARTSQ